MIAEKPIYQPPSNNLLNIPDDLSSSHLKTPLVTWTQILSTTSVVILTEDISSSLGSSDLIFVTRTPSWSLEPFRSPG